MTDYRGETFGPGTTIRLDGNRFYRCKFDRCQIEYGAAGPVHLEGNQFIQSGLMMVGAAGSTIQFLQFLYTQIPGMNGTIESMFDVIRNPPPKARPVVPPPRGGKPQLVSR